MARLRAQQEIIVRILRRPSLRRRSRALGKAAWVRLLRSAGLDDAGMETWHREFERFAPESHQDFLEALGLPPREVAHPREECGSEALREPPQRSVRSTAPQAAFVTSAA